jgi:hypothetical protein
MGQRSNDAAVKDALILLRKVEFAKGMEAERYEYSEEVCPS